MDTRNNANPRNDRGNSASQPLAHSALPKAPATMGAPKGKGKERPLPPQYPKNVKRDDRVRVIGGFHRIGESGSVYEIGHDGEIRVKFKDGFKCRKAERDLEILK